MLTAALFISAAHILSAQPGNRGGTPMVRIGGQAGRPGGQMPLNMERAWVRGTVYLSPEEEGQEEAPGEGAVITILTRKSKEDKIDTTYTVAGKGGHFFIAGLKTGVAHVSFSMMGYEEQARTITLSPGENKFIANLKPEIESLDGAVVKETVQPVSLRGDTIVFHASAVKTEKGEMAIDVLEQMPGVEVSDSGVKVLNEDVRNVYVDGALLFGSAPMKALNNLPAEEVVTIKSYQEYANKDPHHKISRNETKERVLDIETKSKPKFVTGGGVLAGGGFDTDSTFHKFRYTLGGDFNADSETLQVGVRYNINNINDASTRRRGNSFGQASGGGAADLRAESLSLSLNRKWMSPTTRNYVLGSIGGSYSYGNRYNVTESMSERIYFPTDSYTSRSQESRSYSASTAKSHQVSVNGAKALKDGQLTASASYSRNDNSSDGFSHTYNYQDNLPRQGTSTSNRKDSDSDSYSVSFGAQKGLWDKLRLNASMTAGRGSSDGVSTKIDTTTSTITNTVLNIDTGDESRNFSVSPSVRYEISDRSSIGLGYSYSNNYSSVLQWSYDVTDPLHSVLDTVNTYTRTNDNNTHGASLDYRTTFADDKVILSAKLDFKSVGINRQDSFPEDEPLWSKRFNSLRPAVSLGNNTQLNHWMLSWTSTSSHPSIEQLRPRLNNTNLYSVTVGNPDLKQSRAHNFNFAYSTVLGREARETMLETETFGNMHERFMKMSSLSTFSIGGGFSFTNDNVVSRRTYFARETYLPQYGYTMPAQSTLTGYENASGQCGANLQSRLELPVEKIRCMLSTGLSGSWDRSPVYVDNVLTYTQNVRPTLSLGLRSNFSRKVRFNVGASGSYVYSYNSEKDASEYFTEAIRAGFELNNIVKHTYMGGNYTKTFMQGISYQSINDNILDLRGGVRFGPRNNIDFSVNVHDLFNRTSGFSTAMAAEYVRNTWNHNFGRYVMFTLAYRFNKMGQRGGFGGRGAAFQGGGFQGGGFGGPGGGFGGF